MKLCAFEANILRRIYNGEGPEVPGAAWMAAYEMLRKNGYVDGGSVTPKGRAELGAAND